AVCGGFAEERAAGPTFPGCPTALPLCRYPPALAFLRCPRAFAFPWPCLTACGAATCRAGPAAVFTVLCVTACFGVTPPRLTALRAGTLRAGEEADDRGAAGCVVVTRADEVATDFGGALAFRTARTGLGTTAATSLATSPSAGATPAERTELPPPGRRRRRARTIDAAARAAGTALVAGSCWFILGRPSRPQNERGDSVRL